MITAPIPPQQRNISRSNHLVVEYGTDRTTVEESLRGIRLNVGESVRCESGVSMHEGHPVTVVARLRETGRWDVEKVYGVQHVPTDLQAFERRDGEGLALAGGVLAWTKPHHQ